MADSNKILKELSNLSSNFDSLYKELKESTRSNIESSDQVRDLVSQIKESSFPDGEDLKGIFEGFTRSFSKSLTEQNSQLLNGLTDKISQSFTGSVSDFLDSIPQQIAQVKSGQMLDFESILGGDTIKGIVDNAVSVIPGLAEGGTIESDGIAIVGEKGPELVELKSGDKVKTKEEQLLEMYLQEAKGKRLKLDRIKKSGPTEEEVEAYRKKLLDENPEFYSDPVELKEELDYFRSPEGYEMETRETFTLEDLNRLSQPSLLSNISTPQVNEIQNSDKSKSPFQGDIIESSNVNQISTPSALDKTESPNVTEISDTPTLDKNEFLFGGESKLQDLLENAKELSQEKSKKNQSTATASLATNISELKEKETSLQTKNSSDNIKSQVEEKIAEIKESMSKSTGSSTPGFSDVSTLSEKNSSTSKKSKESNDTPRSPTGVGITSDEVSEIKSLLAAIYQTLRGPLTIVNDTPFRPNSNNF